MQLFSRATMTLARSHAHPLRKRRRQNWRKRAGVSKRSTRPASLYIVLFSGLYMVVLICPIQRRCELLRSLLHLGYWYWAKTDARCNPYYNRVGIVRYVEVGNKSWTKFWLSPRTDNTRFFLIATPHRLRCRHLQTDCPTKTPTVKQIYWLHILLALELTLTGQYHHQLTDLQSDSHQHRLQNPSVYKLNIESLDKMSGTDCINYL